jgi:SAM-dependent methyltransferase
MKEYKYSLDYDHPLIAELYDSIENSSDDIELIHSLIDDFNALNILEPFSGTGRVAIPLVKDGHRVVCIEIAKSMHDRAVKKAARLGRDTRNRLALIVKDAVYGDWGGGYDLIILAANSMFELDSPQTQIKCIRNASRALKSGGYLFVDNDDYKGNWGRGPFGRQQVVFEGHGSDGSFGRSIKEALRFDESDHVLQLKRTWFYENPAGEEKITTYLAAQRPVAHDEVKQWLEQNGFDIIHEYGDRKGGYYNIDSERAVFWARKI